MVKFLRLNSRKKTFITLITYLGSVLKFSIDYDGTLWVLVSIDKGPLLSPIPTGLIRKLFDLKGLHFDFRSAKLVQKCPTWREGGIYV